MSDETPPPVPFGRVATASHADNKSFEPRYWRYDGRGTMRADVQPGPAWPRVVVTDRLIGLQFGPDTDVQTFSAGAARWVAVRLIEAAAIWEQHNTEDVAKLSP